MVAEIAENWEAHATGEEKEYHFRPIQGKALRFHVKAAHDCHIAFSPVDEDSSEMFEVFLGAWEGTASAIRFRKDEDIAKVDTPEILSEDEEKEFWVTFEDDFVRVGRGGEHVPFMEAALPEHIEVAYYGYSTGWEASGWWQFYHDRVLQTDDCMAYNYEPIYGTSLLFSVSCSNDAHIALSTGPDDSDQMYEIFIGGWSNQKSAIRLDKDKEKTVALVDTPEFVCADEERSFYINFKNGHIRVGQVGNPEPFIEYLHTDPYEVTHFGYCTAWEATGKWKLEL